MPRHDAVAILSALLLPWSPAAAEETPLPPAPVFDDRDYLLHKQQEIFRLTIETDYAQALQKLCQTGYGDPHLCHSATPNPPVSPLPPAGEARLAVPAARLDLPVLQEIAGLGASLSAILKYDDGRVVTGQAGAILPAGDRLVAVEPRRVLVKRPNGAISSLTLEDSRSSEQNLPSRRQLSAGQP
jgi:type IV pilus biogenesis protein PilP